MARPIIDFALNSGLVTRHRQEDIQAKAFTTAQNIDFFDKFAGLGKLHGSSRKSDTAPSNSTWRSLHYHEFRSLQGAATRHVVGLAGTVLYRINADQTLTSLKTGLVEEPLSGVTSGQGSTTRLFLASENNDPIKYDGDSVTNWGVQPPGGTKTVFENFDSVSGWGANLGNEVVATTADRDGDGAVQVNKVDTTNSNLVLTRSGLAHDFTTGQQGDLNIWLNIPAGAIPKLITSGAAVTVTIGEAGLTDSNSYTKDVGDLRDGWNLLTWSDLTSPDSTSGAGATLTDVNAISLTITFKGAAQVHDGFIWDELYTTDPNACVAAVGASGSVDAGSHSYRITFVTRYGNESNMGSSSNTITSVGSIVSLTAIPTSSDPQVVARNIYRDQGDGVFGFVAALTDNTTTTYTDNTSDAGLSFSAVPPQAATAVDNSPPERMVTVAEWNGYVFGIDAVNKNQLNFTDPNLPESWPTTNIRQFSNELVALVPVLDRMFIFTTDSIYIVRGGETGATSLFFDEANPEIGCSGPRAAVKAKNAAMIWHDDGPYLVLQGTDPWYQGALHPLDVIDDLDPTAFAGIHMVHDRKRFRIIFFIQSTNGGAYDTILVYSYGGLGTGEIGTEGTGVDPLDLRVGRWTTLSLPASVNPTCSAIVESAADTPELWIGTDAGIVYRLQDPDQRDWAHGSLTEAMDAVFETTYTNLNPNSIEGWGWPRFLIVNGETDAGTTATWNFTLTTARDVDGDAIDSKVVSVVLGPGKKSKKVSIPRGLYGNCIKVKGQNNNSNQGGIIKALRLEVVPLPARGVR